MKEQERYVRQTMLPEIGEKGQKLLRKAKVLIVGVGGLGSPVALYLAAAGVGTIGLIDGDVISRSNLNRQILYDENHVGHLKVETAAEKIRQFNSDVQINVYAERIEASNLLHIREIVSGYDIVVDACDNMPTRYMVSDMAEQLSIPFIYGAIEGFRGCVSIFNDTSLNKRFRDLWPEEHEQHAKEVAAVGATAGVVGSLQACEAIKYICGFGERLAGRLLTVDLATMEFHVVSL